MKLKISLISLCLFVSLFFTECKKDKVDLNDGITPHNFLAGDKYDKLIVEIKYVTGFEPTSGTLANLKTFLEQRLNKPAGIEFVQSAIASPGKASYSFSEIKDMEKTHRAQKTDGKTLTAFFLFVDGDYAENSGNSKVLGIAYGTSSMAIFEKAVKEYSGGIGKPTTTALETTVINHEFGHTLGLVNNGTSTTSSHQDAAHGAHCNNKDCLMYYTAETSDIIGSILGGNVPGLDAACINDLKANGGK